MSWSKRRRLNQTDTVVGVGTVIKGDILSEASIRLEGTVEGNIECEGDLTIGTKGMARSQIKARNVFNAGTIHGAVLTGGLLSLERTGKMFGSIDTASLNIAHGGLFEGDSKMQEQRPEPLARESLEEPTPIKKRKTAN